MMLNRRRLAPFGLVLSGLSALAAGILYILTRSFDLPVQIALALVLLGVILAVLLDPRRARELLTGRQARYGSNALVMTLAFLGILVVINFLVLKNPLRWDFTQDKEYSLSKESIEIVRSLKQPVQVEAFFSPNYPSDTAYKLLDSYRFASQGNLTYRFIDPVQNPGEATAAKVSRDGTIVFKMGDRQEQVIYADEQEISSALLRLANPGERVVYFLTGHGEYSLDGSSESSYSRTAATLRNKNYTVEVLDLGKEQTVPENARAVVIAGTRKPLTDVEIASMKAYLDKGGALIALVEPDLAADPAAEKDPLLAYLSSAWGIQVDPDIIIDPEFNPPVVTVADNKAYGQHPITQKLMRMDTLYPTARSIQHATPAAGTTVVDLIQSYPSAYGESDLQAFQKDETTFDPAKDRKGPLSVAVAAVNEHSKARLVVVGDADFASDSSFASYANGDVMVNAVDWAAEQENLLNLTPKTTTQRMMLPPTNFSLGLVLLLSVFLTPGAVLAAGILTWMQRRRRG